MAVSQTNRPGAKAAPQTDTKQPPNNEPKKPQDNTVAKQAPSETRTATKNAFGDVPKKDGAKQADDAKTPDKGAKQSTSAPKLSITEPKGGTTPSSDGKAPADDWKAAPATAEGKASTDEKAPPTDPKSAPASDTSTPPAGDGTAATDTAPKGTLPVTGTPVAPKLAITDPKSAPDPDKVTSPVDPTVQSILDAKLSGGKTVKEKIDADSAAYLVKAAQQHYDVQKQKGEPLDAASKFFLNISAKDIAANGYRDDALTVKVEGVLNSELANKNLEELYKDPEFAKWATEQQANSIQKTIEDNPDIAKLIDPYKQEGENYVNALRRMQSDYMTSQAFADGVATAKDGKTLITEAMKTLSSLGLGEKEVLGVGNTLTENIRSKYAPNDPKTIIDPNTNKAVATEDGYNLAVLPDGMHVGLGTDGKPVADKQGNPYVYNPDRTAKVDANNAYVQYHAKSKSTFASYGGTKYMLDANGKSMVDAQGRPLSIDNDGGAPVALDKDGKTVADKAGNKLVFDPNSGKALADPDTGNAVVIDPVTDAIVQADTSGKIVAGKNGDPYAVDQKTGKFVQDAQGNYVQISKDNIAPGIVPGYVIDANNTKVVVSPENGKPMVDPATGKTVILDPKTNTPQLVPLDANGVPKLTLDGKNIVYGETGHTVVLNEGKGPNWLVNADGSYAQNAGGNYIGVDAKTGLAAPVDENGFVKNGSGHITVWDPKANAPLSAPKGGLVVADEDGNLLAANAEGQTFVEEKSGLPFLLDPKTREVATNPDTGRSILLNQAGLPVEYNADDGYNYLINPETRKTVKTSTDNPVVTNENGLPYAIKPDGTGITNPATGNLVTYGLDGQPAKEQGTGYSIEITASGKAHVIDPKTNSPMAELDPETGGYQIYNADGNEVTNPDSGNKVQLVPDSGLKVEIDAKTSRPVTDAKGNPLVIGKDNRPLKTPDGNAVVGDIKTGLPISADAAGKAIVDPASKLPLAMNSETGVPLSDPDTKAPVVADPKSMKFAQVGKDGKFIGDPVTGMPVAINGKTGAQVKGPNGELAVNDPRSGLPVYYDQPSKLFTVADPDTNKAVTNPDTGAKTVLDVGSGLTFEVLPDAQGNHIIVDESGQPAKDDAGNQPWFDKNTGKVVIVNDKGEAVDTTTGKKPEAFDPKGLVYTAPLLTMPPAIAMMAAGKATKKDWTDEYADDDILPDDPEGGTSNMGDLYEALNPPKSQYKYPWHKPDYTMTPAERSVFIAEWKTEYFQPQVSYERYLKDVQDLKKKYPKLAHIPDAELVAVRGYTGMPWWPGVNKALYSMDPSEIALQEPYIKALKSGLTHLEKAGFTYKGSSIREMKLTPSQFSDLFGGDIFTNHQFMSTAARSSGVYPNDKGITTKVKVNHLNGVNIKKISLYPGQNEIIGLPGKKYAVSNYKPAGSKGNFSTLYKPTKYNQVTPNELPANYDKLLGGNPNFMPSGASKAAIGWAKVGKALGYAADTFDIVGSGAESILGGLQIADGVKDKNPYQIASGALNVSSGAVTSAGTLAALAGAATASLWLGGIGSIIGLAANIVDFVDTLDDDEQFADKLNDMYGPLGLLLDGWRKKAEDAYRDAATAHINPNYQA